MLRGVHWLNWTKPHFKEIILCLYTMVRYIQPLVFSSRMVNSFVLVYYRMYTPKGDIPSKHPIDPDDPSLAHFDTTLVAPPYTNDLIKHPISRVEENPRLVDSQLLADMWSESPMDSSHIPILSENHPGRTPEDPMAIVQTELSEDKYNHKIRVTTNPWGG
jgi:hypothetical protein